MNLARNIKSTINNRKELLDKNRNNYLILELENGESILVFAEGQEINFTVEEGKNEGGPTLHSVFYSMDNYFEKNETYEGLFDKPKAKKELWTFTKKPKTEPEKLLRFMTRTLFDFSDLFVDCIHTEDFTNAVKRGEIKILLANSYIVMRDCSSKSWEEFVEDTDNCHETKSEYIKYRIEARLFGILEKNQPIKHNNLFRALLLDPNHKTYRKGGKNVLASLKDL
ncbi:18582_t:CDS:2, partial [Gigaspora margarita]